MVKDNPSGKQVLYPSLRVEIPEIKIERVRDIPPRLIRPAGVESLDLEIDGYLGSLVTAKGHGLAKLAPQLPIGSLYERGGANPFPCDRRERVVDQRLLKVTLQRCYRFGGAFAPLLCPTGQPLASLCCTLGLVNRAGLFQQLLALFALLFPFEFTACLVRHIAQLVKEAALFKHR